MTKIYKLSQLHGKSFECYRMSNDKSNFSDKEKKLNVFGEKVEKYSFPEIEKNALLETKAFLNVFTPIIVEGLKNKKSFSEKIYFFPDRDPLKFALKRHLDEFEKSPKQYVKNLLELKFINPKDFQVKIIPLNKKDQPKKTKKNNQMIKSKNFD